MDDEQASEHPAVGAVEEAADTSLTSLLVGEIAGDFVVPSYQRGYRWGVEEVTQLLDDIADSEGTYYLQPIVVKPAGESWELIDGQQRLTTLFLIFREISTYVNRFEARYKLRYETREQSAAFLENPMEEQSRQNVDFHFIHRAAELIREWFQEHDDPTLAAVDFYQALAKRVYIIWYEAPDEVDSRTLFTRLNIGRIPLTNAELVKAMVLSRSDRREEVAAQWDSIERHLRSPELWAFVTGTGEESSTHIGLLLDTHARLTAGPPTHQFHTFETIRAQIVSESANQAWDDIVDLYSLLLGWYEDHDLFHKIGYLVLQGWSVADFVDDALQLGRSDFEALLDRRISDQLDLTRSTLTDLGYGHRKCEPLLELMNVETVRRRGAGSHRYSFADHVTQTWSIEHIHAQSAENLDESVQWTTWLEMHREALRDLPDGDVAPDIRAELIERIDAVLPTVTSNQFHQLEQEIIPLFTKSGADVDGVHALTNLALLASADNSALNNSCFEVKRRDVIERDRKGSYVPPATRNVFLKYYTEVRLQQLHFWGQQDRSGYLDAILECVGPYLDADLDQGDDDEQ